MREIAGVACDNDCFAAIGDEAALGACLIRDDVKQ